MAFRIPGCRPLETASLFANEKVLVDGVLLAEGGAAALLGLLGLRFVPMALLTVGWKIGEYAVKACGPLSLFGGTAPAGMRPALGDVAVLLGAWLVGRIARWVMRRRREAALPTTSSLDITVEPPTPPRPTRHHPRPARPPSASSSLSVERSWTTPGSIVLELDEREAEALRAAIDGRLSDLRRVADRPAAGGVRDEIWQTIATLESLLAHLPASHLYDKSGGWSPSGHRAGV
jgi:hypothetical protein